MAYSTANVLAYVDTGFSATNTPLNPTVLLNSAVTTVDLGTINCLPILGKRAGKITISAFDAIDKTDYLRIIFTDSTAYTYWLVTDYEYLAGDTISVSLVLDAWLTCGGSTNITTASGYIKRHTVTDDTYAKYSQEDELLQPSQHLIFRDLQVYGKLTQGGEHSGFYTLVASTINLWAIGGTSATQMGLTYGDVSSGEYVVCPNIPPIPSTFYTTIDFGNYSYKLPGYILFDGDNAQVQEGISRARSLGIEDGIIAMYCLPKQEFTVTPLEIAGVNTGAIVKVQPRGGGTMYQPATTFNFKQVNNNRAIYGSLCTVKLTSMASGEEVNYNIEDLYSATAQNQYIHIYNVGDGRPHGKPWFFPEYYMDKAVTIENLVTSISGMEWQNAPLKFDYASGYGMTGVKWHAGMDVSRQNMYDTTGLELAKTAVRETENIAGGFVSGGALGGLISVYDSADRIGWQAEQIRVDYNNWERSRKLEMKNMLVNTHVVAPDIKFPATEAIRDFVGNGVLYAFITPTDADIERFDKILNMYGYKDVGALLTVSDFTAGTYFSYVEAHDVQIVTTLPVNKMVKDACADQISAGIRLWKARPDFTKYNELNR